MTFIFLKVLSYWNLNTNVIYPPTNSFCLKVLSYWNLNVHVGTTGKLPDYA